MNGNKVCSKCGMVNKFDSKFCIKCGVSLLHEDVVDSEKNNIQQSVNNNVVENTCVSNNDSEGNILGIISLLLFFAGSTIISLIASFFPSDFRLRFSALSGLCPLGGIVVMILGRVKYHTNKFLKVVMWIIICSIILGVIAFVLFFIWCYVTCATMDTSGCS